MKTYLITGGCGFIGSNFIHFLIENGLSSQIVNLDKMTYAGDKENLSSIENRDYYHFIKGDICNQITVRNILERYNPDVVVNFAAESHVDRSIDGPTEFIQTNVVGTLNLLNESNEWLKKLNDTKKDSFRFIHISTDEVYGSLEETGKFLETTPYNPSSPYAASKASSDHLARSWFRTFDFPVMITNCSNNYGPYQFPEKLIPLMILNALTGKKLPVYGNGLNVRDWLYVRDHCRAIQSVVDYGRLGETYNIGGNNEITNIQIVETICEILDLEVPSDTGKLYKEQISFVADRPGHDFRYAIDATKIGKELGWKPKESFDTGIKKTVLWYLANQNWWERIKELKYKQERLGILK
tara:strand:- start:4170 stop:5231 length:1062 start_codon:yes stop_codon:yes gene_type:complete